MNELIVNGKNLADFGVFVTDALMYNSPEPQYEKIEIEGRNGDVLINKNRYSNFVLEYPAVIMNNFYTNYSALRAFLMALNGYVRVEDSFSPDRFHLGRFKGEIVPDKKNGHQTRLFTIRFWAKPQWYYKSGEISTQIGGTEPPQSISGNPVTIKAPKGGQITSLKTTMEPQQSLNGYSYPWPPGGGKNLLPLNPAVVNSSSNGIAFTVQNDGILCVGTATATTYKGFSYLSGNGSDAFDLTPYVGKEVTFAIRPLNVGVKGVFGYYKADGSYTIYSNNVSDSLTVTIPSEAVGARIMLRIDAGVSVNVKAYATMALGNEPTDEPYSNICPISGYDSIEITDTNGEETNTVTVSLSTAGTVYGGSLDVITGQLTVDRRYVTVSDFTLFKSVSAGGLNWVDVPKTYPAAKAGPKNICSHVKYLTNGWLDTKPCYSTDTGGGFPARVYDDSKDLQSFQTKYADLQAVYELATPVTYQLTPQQISLLTGENVVSANAGGMEIKYALNVGEELTLYNPSYQTALPLIRVYGNGTLTVGGNTITVAAGASEYIDIDSEIMDCYEGSYNRNTLVSMTDGFPKLEAGETLITVSGNISKAEITPRWWTL